VIKARARLGVLGQDTIILGLDAENVRRLMDNQPIMFDGVEVGVPGVRFVILGGETLDEVREDLRALGLPIPRRPEAP
jgi:hypothetical protein